MKEINRIAQELKWQFEGSYNDYYHRATIYYNRDNDTIYVINFGQGEHFNTHPKHLIPLCTYCARYGNWHDAYYFDKRWTLTKKQIAYDIRSTIREIDNTTDDYFGKIVFPDWLKDECDYYCSKKGKVIDFDNL